MDTLPKLTGHRLKILALGTVRYLLLRHGELTVQLKERGLTLIFLGAEYHDVPETVTGDEHRLPGLMAEVRYFII